MVDYWFIQIKREISQESFFSNPNLRLLFFDLSLKVNHKENNAFFLWNQEIKQNQWDLIFSIDKWAKERKISQWTLKNRLKCLEKSWIIEITTTNKYTKIRIIKWILFWKFWENVEESLWESWEQKNNDLCDNINTNKKTKNKNWEQIENRLRTDWEQIETINKENKENKENNNQIFENQNPNPIYSFDLFWKWYPHYQSRSRKDKALTSFNKLNNIEKEKAVWLAIILNLEVSNWIAENQYVAWAQVFLNNFYIPSYDVIGKRLKEIFNKNKKAEPVAEQAPEILKIFPDECRRSNKDYSDVLKFT